MKTISKKMVYQLVNHQKVNHKCVCVGRASTLEGYRLVRQAEHIGYSLEYHLSFHDVQII